MLLEKLKGIPILLGSQSPRRKELLSSMGLEFQVEVKPTDEVIDTGWTADNVAEQLALLKLHAFSALDYYDKLIITADTVVVDSMNTVLGKPGNEEEALVTLRGLSAKEHVVYTGVAIGYKGNIHSFTSATVVEFYAIEEADLQYYIEQFRPYDKAGSYGIQEWIGRIGTKSIKGTYENVMGLPTSQLYQVLKEIVG